MGEMPQIIVKERSHECSIICRGLRRISDVRARVLEFRPGIRELRDAKLTPIFLCLATYRKLSSGSVDPEAFAA
jgi:hypothetical protein